MHKVRSIALIIFYSIAILLLSGCKFDMLDPKGIIAADEKTLLLTSTWLMLIVVVPVIFLTLFFAWRYRASNSKAVYAPDWAHSNWVEIICWTVPCLIIGALGTITWLSTHRLDPYKALNTNEKPLIIEVIALEWKWLFIYPEQHIATLNFVQFPVNKPVRFLITAEGPMNSLQIPQLAGQIYAMSGMQTKLNLMAVTEGDYRGISSNFSGNGFADMKFITRVSSQQKFDTWVKQVQKSPAKLDFNTYKKILKPSENNPVTYYSAAEEAIYQLAVIKTLVPPRDYAKCINPDILKRLNNNAR